jgi:hypothetical protein
MHEESPNIIRLGVHLPNEQVVYFQENAIVEEVVDRLKIMLME